MARRHTTGWEIFGFPEDPTPGDVEAIITQSGAYRRISENARDAHTVLTTGMLDSGKGKAMDSLRKLVGEVPGKLERTFESFVRAADAYNDYANTLRDAQSQLDTAIDDGQPAFEALNAAKANLTSAETAKNDADENDGDAVSDADEAVGEAQGEVNAAQADFDAAMSLARSAQSLRRDGSSRASRILRDAATHRIPPRDIFEKIADFFNDNPWVELVLGIIAGLLAIFFPLIGLLLGALLLGIAILKMATSGQWDVGTLLVGLVGIIPGAAIAGVLGKLANVATKLAPLAKVLATAGKATGTISNAITKTTNSLRNVVAATLKGLPTATGKTATFLKFGGKFAKGSVDGFVEEVSSAAVANVLDGRELNIKDLALDGAFGAGFGGLGGGKEAFDDLGLGSKIGKGFKNLDFGSNKGLTTPNGGDVPTGDRGNPPNLNTDLPPIDVPDPALFNDGGPGDSIGSPAPPFTPRNPPPQFQTFPQIQVGPIDQFTGGPIGGGPEFGPIGAGITPGQEFTPPSFTNGEFRPAQQFNGPGDNNGITFPEPQPFQPPQQFNGPGDNNGITFPEPQPFQPPQQFNGPGDNNGITFPEPQPFQPPQQFNGPGDNNAPFVPGQRDIPDFNNVTPDNGPVNVEPPVLNDGNTPSDSDTDSNFSEPDLDFNLGDPGDDLDSPFSNDTVPTNNEVPTNLEVPTSTEVPTNPPESPDSQTSFKDKFTGDKLDLTIPGAKPGNGEVPKVVIEDGPLTRNSPEENNFGTVIEFDARDHRGIAEGLDGNEIEFTLPSNVTDGVVPGTPITFGPPLENGTGLKLGGPATFEPPNSPNLPPDFDGPLGTDPNQPPFDPDKDADNKKFADSLFEQFVPNTEAPNNTETPKSIDSSPLGSPDSQTSFKDKFTGDKLDLTIPGAKPGNTESAELFFDEKYKFTTEPQQNHHGNVSYYDADHSNVGFADGSGDEFFEFYGALDTPGQLPQGTPITYGDLNETGRPQRYFDSVRVDPSNSPYVMPDPLNSVETGPYANNETPTTGPTDTVPNNNITQQDRSIGNLQDSTNSPQGEAASYFNGDFGNVDTTPQGEAASYFNGDFGNVGSSPPGEAASYFNGDFDNVDTTPSEFPTSSSLVDTPPAESPPAGGNKFKKFFDSLFGGGSSSGPGPTSREITSPDLVPMDTSSNPSSTDTSPELVGVDPPLVGSSTNDAPPPLTLPPTFDPFAAAAVPVDVSRITPAPVFRTDNATLYRADFRSPDVIFKEGFQPRNPVGNADIKTYVEGQTDAIFVSTSRDMSIVDQLYKATGKTPNLYAITAPGGIDIPAMGPGINIFPEQKEIAFPGGVASEFIGGGARYYPSNGTSDPFGPFVRNPNYRGA